MYYFVISLLLVGCSINDRLVTHLLDENEQLRNQNVSFAQQCQGAMQKCESEKEQLKRKAPEPTPKPVEPKK